MVDLIPINTRVSVPHGTGTVLDYEIALPSGFCAYVKQVENMRDFLRYRIKLDEGHTWPIRSPYYCSFIHDTKVIAMKRAEHAYLMNPHTGSVDTAENWLAEGYTSENSDLIEVVKDAQGEWIEKE